MLCYIFGRVLLGHISRLAFYAETVRVPHHYGLKRQGLLTSYNALYGKFSTKEYQCTLRNLQCFMR